MVAVSSASVTVATTATVLSGTDPGDGGGSPNGQNIAVKVPTGGVTVYVGGSGVTTANGFPVAAGEGYSIDLAGGEVLYGVVASGTQTVNVLRTGV